MTGNDLGGMDDLAGNVARKTDAELSGQEAELLMNTAIDLSTLRPQLETGDKDFDALIAAVQVATANNESVAQLKQRLRELGNGVVTLAGRVASLL